MTQAQEDELHYPLGATLPTPGTTIEVAPGVRWLRMGLPFALDHINLWLLRDQLAGREGWSIVDCGIDNAATRGAWEQIFAQELQGLPVLRVIVTHMHPDHLGLAHWLTARWSTPDHECRLWISATDWNVGRAASRLSAGFGGDGSADFFALHGLTDPAALDAVRARRDYFPSMVPDVPRSYRRLMDGMTVTVGGAAWTCIAGYGHAPEHMSLYCAASKVLISGDMVLPRISTNVSVYDPEPEGDPLPLYLRSIAAMRKLPADALVLPSHGRPFHGLHERIGQLEDHHRDRFDDVLAACKAAPRSAWDLLPVLFKRPLDLHQTTFAMGESVAHVHALWYGGRLQRAVGDDGVVRFRTA